MLKTVANIFFVYIYNMYGMNEQANDYLGRTRQKSPKENIEFEKKFKGTFSRGLERTEIKKSFAESTLEKL